MSDRPEFEVKFSAAELADVEALESEIQAKLPDAYRNYLLEDGGGHIPRRGYFRVQWPKGYDGFSSRSVVWFTWFLTPGFGETCIYDALESAWRDEYAWPKELLPIAQSDAGGNVFIAIKGPKRGQIFFGYTNDTTEEPSWTNVAWVSDSFDEWLQSLITEEQADAVLQQA
jgi:hypothetical protein